MCWEPTPGQARPGAVQAPGQQETRLRRGAGPKQATKLAGGRPGESVSGTYSPAGWREPEVLRVHDGSEVGARGAGAASSQASLAGGRTAGAER